MSKTQELQSRLAKLKEEQTKLQNEETQLRLAEAKKAYTNTSKKLEEKLVENEIDPKVYESRLDLLIKLLQPAKVGTKKDRILNLLAFSTLQHKDIAEITESTIKSVRHYSSQWRDEIIALRKQAK